MRILEVVVMTMILPEMMSSMWDIGVIQFEQTLLYFTHIDVFFRELYWEFWCACETLFSWYSILTCLNYYSGIIHRVGLVAVAYWDDSPV